MDAAGESSSNQKNEVGEKPVIVRVKKKNGTVSARCFLREWFICGRGRETEEGATPKKYSKKLSKQEKICSRARDTPFCRVCATICISSKKSPLPSLFTYRPKWEGGQYGGDQKERQDVLRLAMELGADYVDVELQVATEFIRSIDEKKPENFKVIVSSHNYENTPSVEDLNDLVARIQQSGADIVKIATTAVDITDVARMFHITSNAQVPTIGLTMGKRGLMSRILCSKFGGYLTFGTLASGKVSAPGQPTIKDL